MKRISVLILLVVLAAGSVWGETKKVVLETKVVSVASDGTLGNEQSNYLSFFADKLSISHYGRYVVFQSDATNLVTGDTNTAADIFLHDTQTNMTTRVSVASDGTLSNGTSAGG